MASRKIDPHSEIVEQSRMDGSLAADALQQQVAALQEALAQERQRSAALAAEKNQLTGEVEELTKVLFEEANVMVASEARARFQVEQDSKHLKAELDRCQEELRQELEQSRLLRSILEGCKNKDHPHTDLPSDAHSALPSTPSPSSPPSQPNLLDVEWFASRLHSSYYDDFLPEQAFHSHKKQGLCWERILLDVDYGNFRDFSDFLDVALAAVTRQKDRRERSKNALSTSPGSRSSAAQQHAHFDDDTILAILEHPYIRHIIHADIEPCLAALIRQRPSSSSSISLSAASKGTWSSSEMRSLLRRLLPAMLRNSCVIESIGGTLRGSSARASPLSVSSYASVRSSVNASPLKGGPSKDPAPDADSALHERKGSAGSFAHQMLFNCVSDSSVNLAELSEALPDSSEESCAFCHCSDQQVPLSHRFRLATSTAPPASSPNTPSSLFSSLLSSSPTTPAFLASSPSFSLSLENTWHSICKRCRDRLVAVATLFTILRHATLLSLHNTRPKIDIFCEVQHARRFMWMAASPVSMDFWAVCDFEAFVKKIKK